ncbi:hypothetical protein [Lysinibacillus sp. NPDC093692]|uniref:hypothetical protein n=1 Tax=Lysinibacillus sp. NPDC093692 TaxID=3390578 RepID=UPI003CFFDD94
MRMIFWTIVTSGLTLAMVGYMIHLLKTRKENLDFPNHIFVVSSVLVISLSLTIVQLYDWTFKWSGNAPMIEGPCTVKHGGGRTPQTEIVFEEKTLSASLWNRDATVGEYAHCIATYMLLTEELIEIHLDTKEKTEAVSKRLLLFN